MTGSNSGRVGGLSKGEGEGGNRILAIRPVAELVTVTAGPCPGQRIPQTHISHFWGPMSWAVPAWMEGNLGDNILLPFLSWELPPVEPRNG